MTAVKICGLTNLEDARWAWQCGADLLGFIFVPSSPRYVPPAVVARITSALVAEGCDARLVGVFANRPIEIVRQIVDICSLDLAQLHGDETPDYLRALGLPSILARRIREGVPWDELSDYPAWGYLLDSYDPEKLGGTGQTWRWELLRTGSALSCRIIVAGGLSPENVAQAIARARPWGVDVSSGVEASPGRKDRAKVERFIQRAKEVPMPSCGTTRG